MWRWLPLLAASVSFLLEAQTSSTVTTRAADLNFISTRLPALDPNFFSQLSRSDFEQALSKLQADLPNLTDAQFYVRLAQLVALPGDAHTYLYLLNAPGFQQLPLHLRWLDDGVFVTSAGPEYIRALGTRIIHIGDFAIDDVIRLLGSVIPHENDQWLHHQAQTYLAQQQVLEGLGITAEGKPVPITFQTLDGSEFTLFVNASNETRISLLSSATGSIPDYLANSSQYYWFNYSSAIRMLYFKYNVCQNDPSNPFSSFAAAVLSAIDSNPVDTLVFDFRGNTGGSDSLINPLYNGVVQRLPKLRSNPSFALYAAIDKGTFSSGMDDAGLFKQPSLMATLIGEPTGGRPAHFGNVASFTLPASQILGQYSTSFIPAPSYVPAADPSLEPDVKIPIRSTDYFARFDPVMAAILARSSSPPALPPGSVTVVNAASSRIEQGIGPGSLAAAFGMFSTAPDQVLVSGAPAQLLSSTRSRVLFVVPPAAAAGSTSVSLRTTGAEIASATALITSASPGVFTWQPGDPQQPGLVEYQSSTFNTPSHPASSGDLVQIFATGISADPTRVQIFFGDIPTAAVSIELVGFGLSRVTARIPGGLPSGLIPVFVLAGTFASNAVTITVQ